MNRGQASLEMVAALICILLLLIGSVKISTWAAGRMMQRQEAYESSRLSAGSVDTRVFGVVTEGDAIGTIGVLGYSSNTMIDNSDSNLPSLSILPK